MKLIPLGFRTMTEPRTVWEPARMRTLVTAGALAATAILPLSAAGPVAHAAGVAHCTDSQLKVREGRLNGGAGHIGFPIHFKNHSSTTCSLRGYPGAAGLNKHGKQVVQAKRTRRGMVGGLKPHHPIPTVVLHPGQVASAVVEGSDVPFKNHKCRTLHGMLITPPNDYTAVHIKQAPPDCSGIEVHPVIKGKSGSEFI
jgi:Domain of unknown function (DUF4232)